MSDHFYPDVVIKMSLLILMLRAGTRPYVEKREELKCGLLPDLVGALGRVDDVGKPSHGADANGSLRVRGESNQAGKNFHSGQGVVCTI